MKEIDLITLKLDNLGEKVVSRISILNIIRDVVHNKPENYLKKLRENSKIKTIFQKYYYILSENERKIESLNYFSFELVFAVLNKLNIKWYISFEKGLESNNVLWQSHKRFTIINNKISRKCIILGTEFEFKKTKSKFINNYTQNKTKNRITQNIGSNERIYVDFIYFNKTIPLELKEQLNLSNIPKIINLYSKRFKNKVRGLLNE